MKNLYKLLLFLSILTITIQASSTKTIRHTIRSGESLYLIAKKNHTTVERLCKINGISKKEVLKIGQTIKVPRNHTKKKKHIVKKSVKSHEKKLAKVLARLSTKTVRKHQSKKVKKFTLSDIVFGSSGSNGRLSEKSKKIIELAKKKLGKRYVWGAVGQKNTFDCSGLTSYVCKANGIKIPRRAIEQSKYGKYVSRSELQPGDLIFFDTSKKRKGYVNHVGIYIGNGKFIHASSAKKKVVITSLDKPFYSQRYKGARRVASL